jgi:hypothetical protein
VSDSLRCSQRGLMEASRQALDSKLTTRCRYLPLALVGAHAGVVAYLTTTLCVSLYRLYIALRPSQGTRARTSRRVALAPLFAGLALVSLLYAGYSSARYATVSYKVWADQRGIAIPDSYVSFSFSLKTLQLDVIPPARLR